MKFITQQNNYINPFTNEVIEDVYVEDGYLKDDPSNQRLEVSFRLQKNIIVKELDFSEETPREIEVPKIKTITEMVLIFDNYERPTMVTIDNNQVSLIAFLKDGGKLNGDEEIIVGYANYSDARKYFLKDNLGDRLEINPALDALYKQLVQLFFLKGKDKYGKPIGFYGEHLGVQFKFKQS